MLNKFIKFCISILICINVQATLHAQPFLNIPKGYFTFPIMPGQPNYLAGNFGELRSNHFHCGLDIKTNYTTGLPVYSAADGFVKKIYVSTKGYGNTIHIQHYNGFVTVYAHLESFEPKLAAYVRKKQIESQTFEIELNPNPSDFQYKQKDIIAYSGNTGSSGGPHLHFEIRDTANNVYNPMLFGFNEIKDNVQPIFSRLSVRSFTINSRVQDEFGRKELTVVKQNNGNFGVKEKVTAFGSIAFEVGAYDRQNGTSNLNGVKRIELKMDGKVLYNHDIIAFPFELQSHINAHIDYETHKTHGKSFQRCYIADGNRLDIYNKAINNGKININDTLTHQITITAWDADDNKSELNFKIKGTYPHTHFPKLSHGKPTLKAETHENILKINILNASPNEDKGVFYINGKTKDVVPDYINGSTAVYLLDLRYTQPDSFKCGILKQYYAFKEPIYPNKVSQYYSNSVILNFLKYTLYDTLYLQVSESNDPKRIGGKIYQVNSPTIPLYSDLFVTLKTNEKIENKDKAAAYLYSEGGGLRYLGGKWNGDIIDFKTKYLGKFAIRTDLKAPDVKLISKSKTQLKFEIDDWPSGIEKFDGYLNGKWVLFNYEHKKKLIWLDNPSNQILKGEFILKVTDKVGNVHTYKTKL